MCLYCVAEISTEVSVPTCKPCPVPVQSLCKQQLVVTLVICNPLYFFVHLINKWPILTHCTFNKKPNGKGKYQWDIVSLSDLSNFLDYSK